MSGTIHRARILGLLCLLAALCAACSSTITETTGSTTAGSTPPAGGTPAVPTATPLPSCATLIPGAATPAPPSNFADLHFPTASVASAPTTSGGGTGQYTTWTMDVCYHGTLDQVNGPFSGHSSVMAYLFGTGYGLGPVAFPDDNQTLTGCTSGRSCFIDDGLPHAPRFVSIENLHDNGGGFITYHLKLAQVVPAPSCDAATFGDTSNDAWIIYQDNNDHGSGYEHFLLPPATLYPVHYGGGTAGSTYFPFCSAGTPATIIAFLQTSMTAAGWTLSGVTASGFSGQYPITGGHRGVSVQVTSSQLWYIRVFHAPLP